MRKKRRNGDEKEERWRKSSESEGERVADGVIRGYLGIGAGGFVVRRRKRESGISMAGEEAADNFQRVYAARARHGHAH